MIIVAPGIDRQAAGFRAGEIGQRVGGRSVILGKDNRAPCLGPRRASRGPVITHAPRSPPLLLRCVGLSLVGCFGAVELLLQCLGHALRASQDTLDTHYSALWDHVLPQRSNIFMWAGCGLSSAGAPQGFDFHKRNFVVCVTMHPHFATL